MRAALIIIMLVVPTGTTAAVIINEVAWMGTGISANDEWIELYNSANEVDMEGWELTDGVSLTIPLTGTLAAGAYAVLERTDDTSAPGTAFLIYTGALSNGGSTLYLKRTDGGTEDQVAGGEGWENIGGDNQTKATAQLTTSGWITAAATPGAQNESVADEETIEEDPQEVASGSESAGGSSGAKPSSGSKKTVSLTLPVDAHLKMSIDAPDVAYVNQVIPFEAGASGIGKTLLNSLKYTWNFGDFYSGAGKKTTHSFRYPGTYVVVAEGAYARHESSVQHTITVLPVTLSMSRTSEGDLQIHNNAKYQVELDGFRIKGNKELFIPDNTIILPNSTITVQRSRFETGSVYTLVSLYDAKGNMVVMHGFSPNTVVPNVTTNNIKQNTAPLSVEKIPFSGQESQNLLKEEVTVKTVAVPSVASSSRASTIVVAKDTHSDSKLNIRPYFGLAAIIFVGVVAIYANRKII